jgi:hypothetical protein
LKHSTSVRAFTAISVSVVSYFTAVVFDCADTMDKSVAAATAATADTRLRGSVMELGGGVERMMID